MFALDPVSPLPALAATSIALCTASLIAERFGTPPAGGRFATIDGLRGYLAFFVFLHHACVWYFYRQTGQWTLPPSRLYTHLGQASVIVFFMITGFLFYSRILNGREHPIDWPLFFVSRLLRLWPLYLFAISVLSSIVFVLSHGKLVQPIGSLLSSLVAWICFTILGAPNLNGVSKTAIIVAGVTWTLCFEVMFYLSLPIIAVLAGLSVSYRVVLLGFAGCALVAAAMWPIEPIFFVPFLAGVVTAMIVRYDAPRRLATRPIFAWIALAFVVAATMPYPSTYAIKPIFLLFVAFTIVACGNDLFGILLHRASRTLGALSYSIYMLHGLGLFLVFGQGPAEASIGGPSALIYWAAILLLTPLLVTICFGAYCSIERPSMRLAARIARKRKIAARSPSKVSLLKSPQHRA